MPSIIYKWLIIVAFAGVTISRHPVFVSVTEINHNAGSKALEITCKIFTSDLETTLRKKYESKVDLLNIKFRPAMNKMVNDYIQQHLLVRVNGTLVKPQFLGFEQQEDAVVSYLEVNEVPTVSKLEVVDNILYEYNSQQMGIIHITVKGERKSRRLNNPEDTVSFLF